jgi:hypothetical protein
LVKNTTENKKAISGFISSQMEKTKATEEMIIEFQDSSNREHSGVQKEVDVLQSQMSLKVNVTEFTKIQTQFSRFALYDDLKELNLLIVPEISKFEEKLIKNSKKID